MKTRVLKTGQLCLSLAVLLSMSACNKDDFYQKEFLDNPYQDAPVDDGTVDGGTTGSTSGGPTTGGTNGSATGGSSGGDDGSSAGGTNGGDDGSSTGGTDGSATGGTTGGSTGGAEPVDCEATPNHSDCKTETFQQTSSPTKKLDIVWVIDNSGSMSDEQHALGVNFNLFIQEFINKNVDFKMAITTTDTSSSSKKGRMVYGSDTKLTSAAAQNDPDQFMEDFRDLVRVGTSGSGNEKGLEASEGFMDKYAAGFLRPDAYLAVVMLSDEEDQSSKAVNQYTDYLKSFKSEGGLVKVYSIVDVTGSNCCSSYGVTTGHERYAEASELTAGEIYDIREDFGLSLSDMGDSIANLLDSFALAGKPIADTIKVYVNGALDTNWTYDAATRSVKFTAGSVPAVGSEITVKYQQQ